VISFVEAATLVEVVEDGRVDGNEFLRNSHPPEALHCYFSSSQWKVRVLNSVIGPSTSGLQIVTAQITKRGVVRRKPVGDQDLRLAIEPHQFSEHFQRGAFVSSRRNGTFQHPAFVIESLPWAVPIAIVL
jgi:hypothetical protein